MRDPAVLDPEIRAYLEAENAYAEAALGRHRGAAGHAVRRDEGPHQGGRLLGAGARTGRMPISRATARAASIRSSAASRATAAPTQVLLDGDALAKGKAFFQLGGTRALARPSAARVVGRRQRLGVLHAARPRSRDRRRSRRRDRRTSAASPVWTADRAAFYYVRLDANHRPSRVYRHRLGTPAADDDAGLRGSRQPASFVVARTAAVRPLRARSRCTTTRPPKSWLLDLADRGRRSRGWSRRARPSVQYDVEHHPALGGEDGAGHPHQRRRRRRLQDRARAAGRARPRELARSRPAPARASIC